eukprot:scpid59290/ scgid4387/ 
MNERSTLLTQEKQFQEITETTAASKPKNVPRFPLLLHDLILASKLNDETALRTLNSSILEELDFGDAGDNEKPCHGADSGRSFDHVRVPKLSDLEDIDGWTPLHSACESKSPAAVSYLLEEDCSPNRPARNQYGGMTAMHVACFSGNAQIVEALVCAGGMLLAPSTTNGLIPIDLASCTPFPSKALADIIERHSGIKVAFECGDDAEICCGPILKSRRFYTILPGRELKYRFASEEEVREAILIGGRSGLPKLGNIEEAAKALVGYARSSSPIPVGKGATNQSISSKFSLTPLKEPISPNAALSDSFSELMASRETYMSTAQHAVNILDSDTAIANKENTPPGESNPASFWTMAQGTPIKKTPVEPANPDLFPVKITARPAAKMKHARFAPGVQSPISTRPSGRRVHSGHPVLSLRKPLADITEVSTPTARAPMTKPPTPFPKTVAKKLDGIYAVSHPTDDKENQKFRSAKVDVYTKARSKKTGLKRVAFQDHNEEHC